MTEQYYRLNHGCHVGPLAGWERPKGEDGKPMMYNTDGQPILHPDHIYKWNEEGNNIIRTTDDLGKKGAKFTLVHGDIKDINVIAGQANLDLINTNNALLSKIKELEAKLVPVADVMSTVPGLEGLSFKQLQDLAKEYKLNVAGFSKEKLVKALQEHQDLLDKE